MKRVFANVQYFESDVYVGDYTQYAKNSSVPLQNKGVVLDDKPLELIDYLHLENPNAVKILAVNFEKNPSFFKPDGIHKVRNCECMFVADSETSNKKWLILAELKYCKGNERSIIRNFEDALDELKKTHLYLRDEKCVLKNKEYRCYWVISMPEHGEYVPFSAFVLDQNDLLEYNRLYNVTIISDNVVKVWTSSVILHNQ